MSAIPQPGRSTDSDTDELIPFTGRVFDYAEANRQAEPGEVFPVPGDWTEKVW